MASEPRDILTLDEARAAVGITLSDTSYDTDLEVYVTAASRTLETYIGPVVALSVTDERHDGARHTITLRHRPVMSVSAVEEYTSSGGGPTVLASETLGTSPTDAYLLEPYAPIPALSNGMVHRRTSGVDSAYEWGRLNVAVTYTAGRAADTASVDRVYKRACALVLKNSWRDQQIGVVEFDEYQVPKQSFPGFALPNVVKEMLAEEMGQHEPWGIC